MMEENHLNAATMQPQSESNDEGLVEITVEETAKPRGEQLQRMLSEKQPFVSTEDTDPLEWVFRKAVPIPKRYYWDVVDKEQQKDIPRGIKLWHDVIGSLDSAYHWGEEKVAKPIAGGLGLTASRFDYVTNYMTEEELEESRAKAQARAEEIREQKDELSLDMELASFGNQD